MFMARRKLDRPNSGWCRKYELGIPLIRIAYFIALQKTILPTSLPLPTHVGAKVVIWANLQIETRVSNDPCVGVKISPESNGQSCGQQPKRTSQCRVWPLREAGARQTGTARAIHPGCIAGGGIGLDGKPGYL